MVLRFIDTSKTQGVEHAAMLLKDSWRLSWTKTLVGDTDHTLYVQALDDLVRMIQKDCNVALLCPDPEFNCLRRFHFGTERENEVEIRAARQFLLAVTRRIFEKLGHMNPFILCFDNIPERLAEAARNATSPADPLVLKFPPLVKRFALDRGWGTEFLLNGPIPYIGASFNEWRMENGLDPVYHAYVEPVVTKWREIILRIVQQQDKATPRPSVVSVEADDPLATVNTTATTATPSTNETSTQKAPAQRRHSNNTSVGKLDLVVPSLCLQFAKDRKMDLTLVQEPKIFETLVDQIIQWREEKQMGTLPRTHITSNVSQWKRNVDLVLRSVETSQDLFLESLNSNVQSFLEHQRVLTSDKFVSVDIDTLKLQYRSWRQKAGLSVDICSDMEITDGRSRVIRLQAAACALRRPESEKRLSEMYKKQQKLMASAASSKQQ